MRRVLCLCWLLGACTSREVLCDGRLQPVNLPVAVKQQAGAVAVPSAERPAP